MLSAMRPPPPLDPDRHALFLDFDGTFVDFAPEPDAIRLRPGSIALLEAAAARLGGALALITGRRLDNLDRHVAPLRLPAAGLHGQETRLAWGPVERRRISTQMEEARRRIGARLGDGDRLRLEDKGGALVLHYRTAPEEAGRARAIAAEAVGGLDELHAQIGNAIVEIRQRGIGKGDAVRRLAAAPPFAGRVPVFVGDDTTDEDGFVAAAAAGGFGVKVGPGETAAAFRLADVGAVHEWLAAAGAG